MRVFNNTQYKTKEGKLSEIMGNAVQTISENGESWSGIVVLSTKEVESFFSALLQIDSLIAVNFDGNPNHWAAFAKFEIGNKVYCADAPRALNGDIKWKAYPKVKICIRDVSSFPL